MSFSLAVLYIYLYFVFVNLITIFWFSVSSPCLGFIDIFEFAYLSLSQNVENFHPHFLKYCFCINLLSFWDSNDLSVGLLISHKSLRLNLCVLKCYLSVLQIRKLLLIYLQIHSLFLLSFLFCYWAHPVNSFFLDIFFRSTKTFWLLKKWAFSSDENVYLYILFKSVHLYLMKYGYQSAFKCLSDHSNIWVIPGVTSVNYLFFRISHIFQVVGMLGNFRLHSEHFKYYAVRL